jgi:DNA/RNA-binding domain of Phe-tRNA-synthetase-like protein
MENYALVRRELGNLVTFLPTIDISCMIVDVFSALYLMPIRGYATAFVNGWVGLRLHRSSKF